MRIYKSRHRLSHAIKGQTLTGCLWCKWGIILGVFKLGEKVNKKKPGSFAYLFAWVYGQGSLGLHVREREYLCVSVVPVLDLSSVVSTLIRSVGLVSLELSMLPWLRASKSLPSAIGDNNAHKQTNTNTHTHKHTHKHTHTSTHSWSQHTQHSTNLNHDRLSEQNITGITITITKPHGSGPGSAHWKQQAWARESHTC